jgi:hypothetical protein
MTREEQIQRESEVYAWTANQFDIQLAFIKGAEWADEHPKKSIKDQLKAVLTANGMYAGSSTTAQLLRGLADEWDD